MDDAFQSYLEPGMFVKHPGHPEWGVGQVQSAISWRVTVSFPDEGKLMIDARHVTLVVVSHPD